MARGSVWLAVKTLSHLLLDFYDTGLIVPEIDLTRLTPYLSSLCL